MDRLAALSLAAAVAQRPSVLSGECRVLAVFGGPGCLFFAACVRCAALGLGFFFFSVNEPYKENGPTHAGRAERHSRHTAQPGQKHANTKQANERNSTSRNRAQENTKHQKAQSTGTKPPGQKDHKTQEQGH